MAYKLRFKKGKPAIKPSHEGLLHEDLRVPEDKKIPKEKLDQALHSKDPDVRKRANFARNAASWKH